MNIIDILKQDYQQFPENQSYQIYADNVYFEDPMNHFNGLKRYQQMIGFMKTWFWDIQLDLHNITQTENLIETRWTLSCTTPLPWKPRISISGRSELKLNPHNLIESHIDYWDCSRWDVVKQLFLLKTR